MNRYPSPLVKVGFEGPDVQEETLYELFRASCLVIALIATILSHSTAVRPHTRSNSSETCPCWNSSFRGCFLCARSLGRHRAQRHSWVSIPEQQSAHSLADPLPATYASSCYPRLAHYSSKNSPSHSVLLVGHIDIHCKHRMHNWVTH
jgi:hypothetical protein